MQYLKQSTAATVTIGPILDSTGAEYTGAVIGDISIRKSDGTSSAALASAATLTHDANGYYKLVFTTANTDTLGRLDLNCNKSTYQMPQKSYMVLPATVYDALVTNATNVTGGLVAATGTVSAAAGYIGNATAALSVDASGRVDIGKISGDAIAASNAKNFWLGAISAYGTAQAGSASTITLASGASAADNFYNNAALTIVSGTGAGQTRQIISYVGSTKVATVDSNWVTIPDNTSVYQVLGRIV